jgi:hypothetical protein
MLTKVEAKARDEAQKAAERKELRLKNRCAFSIL